MDGDPAKDGGANTVVDRLATVTRVMAIAFFLSSVFIAPLCRKLGIHRLDTSVNCEKPERFIQVCLLWFFYEPNEKMSRQIQTVYPK